MIENINFIKLDNHIKKGIIEALIFASEDPLDIDTLVKLVIPDFHINRNDDNKEAMDLTQEFISQNEDLKNAIINIIIQ